MVERLFKTIKHGITVLAATPEAVDYWDEHLAKVLFGYRCGIQSSTKFSPYMILTGRTPHLRADNYLQAGDSHSSGDQNHFQSPSMKSQLR